MSDQRAWSRGVGKLLGFLRQGEVVHFEGSLLGRIDDEMSEYLPMPTTAV